MNQPPTTRATAMKHTAEAAISECTHGITAVVCSSSFRSGGSVDSSSLLTSTGEAADSAAVPHCSSSAEGVPAPVLIVSLCWLCCTVLVLCLLDRCWR